MSKFARIAISWTALAAFLYFPCEGQTSGQADSGGTPKSSVIWEECFDEGKDLLKERGWTMPKGASLAVSDREGAGMCLHVPCHEKRGFAEINVRVLPGKIYRASAWVKCREATGPRGASLFLQFSDSEKKHVNGGSFPKGLMGTRDWELFQVHHTIPIPEKVAYVRVTVGVDGRGEAWFDDLRLEEVTRWAGIQPLTPSDGDSLQTALPEFQWEDCAELIHPLGLSRYSGQLELSQEPSFQGKNVIRFFPELSERSFRLDRALAPGTWHWRINLLRDGIAFPPSPFVSFEISKEAICWPPQLVQDWSWSDAPRPKLALRVRPSKADIREVEAQINGKQAKVLSQKGGRISFRPRTKVPRGVHHVQVTVHPDGKGRGAKSEMSTLDAFQPVTIEGIFCNKEPACRVSFRRDGLMLVDGEATFPIGAYRDPSDREDVFDGLLEGGFDLTHSYRMDNEAIHRPQERRQYLESAHANGIGVFLGMPRDMVRERKTLELARYVADTMDTPGLLAWYQFDEPEIQACSPEALMQTYRALSAVDPFHPKITLVCSIGFPVKDTFRRYAEGCDVFWEDPYPVPSKPLLMVEEKILACREAAGPSKPVWCVLQGHSWEAWHAWKGLKVKNKGQRSEASIAAMKVTGTIPATRPTAKETRCMAHLAIAAGSKGLIWYWSPNYAVHVKEDSPEIWHGIKETVKELRELIPWLIAEPTPDDEVRPPEPLRCWSRLHEGKRIVAVINPTKEEVAIPADRWKEGVIKDAVYHEAPDLLVLAPYEVLVFNAQESKGP